MRVQVTVVVMVEVMVEGGLVGVTVEVTGEGADEVAVVVVGGVSGVLRVASTVSLIYDGHVSLRAKEIV